MTIPRVDLDDLRYDDLVGGALTLIPRRLPSWTDHNPSDPGITLLELFAYLAESLGFALSQYESSAGTGFARLLGGERVDDEPLAQTLARAVGQLTSVSRAVTESDVVASVLGGVLVFDLGVAADHAAGTPVELHAVGPITTTLSATATLGDDALSVVPPAPRQGELIVVDEIDGSGEAGVVSEVVDAASAEIRLLAPLRRGHERGTSIRVADATAATGSLGRAVLKGALAARMSPDHLPSRFVAMLGQGSDAEALVGARLGRVAAIAEEVPGTAAGEDGRGEPLVQILVVPPRGGPPDEHLAQLVYDQLSERAVATTRLRVSGPTYVELDIDVTVVRQRFGLQRTDTLREEIAAELRTYLDPVIGGPRGDGWGFGAPVYRAGLNRLLEVIDGVDHVQRLAIDGDDSSDAWPLSLDPSTRRRTLVSVPNIRVDVLDAMQGR